MSLDSEEDLEALRERVRRDPAAAEEAAKLIYIDGLLLEAARRKPQRRRWPWIVTGAAAALLVMVFWPRGWPRLESWTREVAYSEDHIWTGSGQAVLVYRDGTRLEVGRETEVEDLRSGRIRISKGTLRATVARQPSPLVFATPQGEARVLGTVLRLVVARETRLEVLEGKVELRAAAKSVVVTAGRYASSTDLVSRPIRLAAAELVDKAPPGSWVRVPGTALRPLSPDPIRFPKIQGITGIAGLMVSWSGGVFDPARQRLVVWGGGHSNYWGNEVYAFDLGELRWLRLTEPTAEPALNQDAGADGRPTARSTYGGLAYLDHLDSMFAQGGCLAGNGSGKTVWLFDFGTGTWSSRTPTPSPDGGFGCTAAYDPELKTLWWGSAATSFAGLWSFNGTWVKHTEDDFSEQGAAVDTKRGQLVLVGQGEVFSYDIRIGKPKKQVWTTSGGDAFVAKSGMGFEYAPSLDRFYGWHGGAVYELNPETKAWRVLDVPGAPETSRNGVFGRWRWVPSLGAFVLATHVDADVFFFKPGEN